MTVPLGVRADDIHRTALLAVHDGSQPTLEAAIAAHAGTGVIVCADRATCLDSSGQAALLTAMVTAVRAFGTVSVAVAAPETVITTGVLTGMTIAAAAAGEGAQLATASSLASISDPWPVMLVGPGTLVPPELRQASVRSRPVLRASWSGWTASVRPSAAPLPESAGPRCVLAAIAAAAMGISEAFGWTRGAPGSDAGFRSIALNLWDPANDSADHGPALLHAPAAWWLVGLGHLGQAYSWAISWLPYANPSSVEIVLQDADRTIPANHSTGVLTPKASCRVRKTRLVAAGLDHAGFDTRIIERCLGPDLHADPAECYHVALMGVDNLSARRLTSGAGWRFAVDIGLGTGPASYSSLLMRRFPGAQTSDEVTAWADPLAAPTVIPASPAFTHLTKHHDHCGVVDLAGKAVGAAFVGIVAACLAIAETCRELHNGAGHDILTLDLSTMDHQAAAATQPADVISSPLTASRGRGSARITSGH